MMGKVLFVLFLVQSAIIAYLISNSHNETKPSLSLQNWRLKGNYFSFEGNLIFFTDESGNGKNNRTLLLIHGFPTNSFDFAPIYEDLKLHFSRIVSYDQIGFGFSDKPTRSTFQKAQRGQGKGFKDFPFPQTLF